MNEEDDREDRKMCKTNLVFLLPLVTFYFDTLHLTLKVLGLDIDLS